jgi:hypothetical protein
MTPTPERELAEKILDNLRNDFHDYSGPKQDRKDRARFLVESLLKDWQEDERSVMLTRALFEVLPKVNQARLEERERCAKIAEANIIHSDDGDYIAKGITAQIRSSK